MPINKETFELIVANSFDTAWYIEIPENKVRFVNQAPFENLTGHSVDLFYKYPQFWPSLLHEEDGLISKSLYQECLDLGTSEGQYRLIHADETERWVLNRMKLVKDKDGLSVGIIGNAMDITQEKLSTSRLLAMSQDMEEQTKKVITSAKMSSLGEMAAGIAHEINNPLAIIIGSTYVLRTLLKPEKENPAILKEQIENISITANRIVKIIKGLQLFSRNTADDAMESESIKQIISSTLSLCQEKFKINSIELMFEENSAEDFKVKMRSIQISQVLLNLLNNSFDAISKDVDKWVKIEVENDDKFIIVSVTDSGSRINDVISQKVMDPFFTTKDVGKGTGLGLSISKGIIDGHNGILFYDKECSNTRFVIKLPLET